MKSRLILFTKRTDRMASYLLALFLLLLTALPLFVLFKKSFQQEGTLSLFDSEMTFSNYVEVFTNFHTYDLLMHTFLFVLGALAIALTIALIMAYLVERTDLPFKEYAYIITFLPMAIPGAITAIGWTFLLNPTNGMVNQWIRAIFGLDTTYGPINIYTYEGMIFISGISFAPTIFLMISSLMKNLDPSMEDAASASGAGKFGIARFIVLPLLRPGLLSVFIYFFIILFESLEVPLVLGMNANFPVLSVEIYKLTVGGSREFPNYELASTFAMITLIIGLVLISIYFYFTRQADKYAVVSGKGYRPKLHKLGKWRFVAYAFFGLFFLLKLGLPFLVLLWSSLMPYFQNISLDGFKLITLQNYITLFNLQSFMKAVVNTVIMTLAASLITMLLATYISWKIVRERGWVSKLIDVLSFLPNLLPGVVIGIALLLASIGTPFYGTLTVLIVGFTLRFITFSVRMMTGLFFQISKELEFAAYASGANKFTTFCRIILPLVLPAFANGFLWVASHTMKDLTLPIFLLSTSNIVVGSLIWQSWTTGNIGVTACLSVLLVVVLLVVVTPVQFYLGRRSKLE